jgi:ribosome biogenesis GTPase A
MQSIIHWFPGHMHRTRRQLAELMPSTDVLIEVLDARIPTASHNPLLHGMRGDRHYISVLNKSDLAHPPTTQAWLRYFQTQGHRALALCARDTKGVRAILTHARHMVPPRNFRLSPLVCLIVGIPNTGKSTLLNTLAGRTVSQAADKAAITRAPKRIFLDDETTIYDTPGVLWPKLDNQEHALLLAATGAIRETALDLWTVAVGVLRVLLRHHRTAVEGRYGVSGPAEAAEEVLEGIGRCRGCLRAGGEVDQEKAAHILLSDLRGGKLGRMSLQFPPITPDGVTSH